MDQNKLYEVLKKKLAAAQSEKELYSSILKEASLEFDQECRRVVAKLPEDQKKHIESRFTKQEQTSKEKKQKDPKAPSQETKSIYRKIASRTHPDKQEVESEETTKKFTDAKAAIEEGDYSKLYDIADDLGIDTGDPTPEQLDSIKQLIQEEQDKIKSIENSLIWNWYHATSSDLKEGLMKRFLQAVLYGQV
jgi:FtsZ-interacting cell division protein ZipA